jgi:Tol biopolymer transport system component
LGATILAGCTTPIASPAVSPVPTASASATSTLLAPTAVPPSPSPAPLAGPGRIVFTEYQGSGANFKIFTMNPDGTDLKVVFTGANAIPRWSPDGRQISITTSSFDSEYVATVINADGSGAHDLRRPDPTLALSCTAWSPDDNRLACEGWDPSKPGREGIYTIRASDGGGLTRLTTTTAGIHDIPGDFSGDGTQVIFIRATYTVVSLGQLWIANTDGSGAHKIADALVGYRISWSRDGRWIAASANGALLIFDVSNLGTAPLQIKVPNTMAANPRWSPDGTKLVFGLSRTDVYGREVYTVNRDGTNPKRLTSGLKRDEYPDWGLTP